MPLLTHSTFICVDCETTGLDPKHDRIIEVAVAKFNLETTLDSYESLVNPEMVISEESMLIHHINPGMLEGKPTIDQILPEIFKLIGEHPIIGHGVSFDIDLLANAAERSSIPCKIKQNPVIDTLRLARHYGDSPNNSLKNLAHHFNVPSEGAHRAMNDVMMNIAVFKYLIKRFKTMEEVFNILAHPIKMKYMPLGKHRGRLFPEVPLQYLQWASQMDFDQDLLYSIRMEIRKRKQGGGFSEAGNPFSGL